jgi:dipeptidyl aminopeptidase/acylaminoacyl peptidase
MESQRLLRLIVLACLAVLLTADSLAAQDGRIVAVDTIRPADDVRQRLAERAVELGFDLNDVLRHVMVQRITYLSDGLRVRGYLVEPVAGSDLPAVIYNRGGNREFGALSDNAAFLMLAPLARHGYVVVASQYRGNLGGEGAEEFGGADVGDVLNLIPLLDQHPRVDAARLGMYGWSRGGMMTYLALTRTDRIRAAVVGAGMSDAFDIVARRPEMEDSVMAQIVPDWSTEREAALEARSAVRWPERLHKGTPILLLHGSSDWRVHPSQALDMARALYEVRHPFRLVFFEGDDHGLTANSIEVNRLVLDWLNRYVRDGAPLPDLEPHGRE